MLTIVVESPGTLEVLRAYVNLQKLYLSSQLTGRKSLSASRIFLALFFLTNFMAIDTFEAGLGDTSSSSSSVDTNRPNASRLHEGTLEPLSGLPLTHLDLSHCHGLKGTWQAVTSDTFEAAAREAVNSETD